MGPGGHRRSAGRVVAQHVPRGGVLGTQRLLDVLDGVTEDASVRAPLLAEERRLLVAAMGRARRRLLVTAVDSDTGGADEDAALPSAFFFEIAQWTDGDGDHRCGAAGLSAAGVVGGGAGGPVARRRVCARRRGGRRRSRLRGNAIGPVGQRRRAGRRPGRLARPDPRSAPAIPLRSGDDPSSR